MRAIVLTKHGPPERLQLQEVPKPTPGDHEVLIQVCAATVTSGDVVLRKMHPLLYLPMRLFGIRPKRIPGHELAGTIVAVGKHVTQFEIGDAVFGTTTGLRVGGNAEFVCLPETWATGVLARRPSNLTCEEAAAVPVGGMTALYILKKANIQPGQKALVYGASGSVGTYAVQLASHHFGAEVTGVCSTDNIELVKSLGANTVIDYTQDDVTQHSEQYDVIFDAVGKIFRSDCEPVLRDSGVYLSVQTTTHEEMENFLLLKDLIEAGKLRPVIDKTYPLEQVAEAHRYVESGRKKGNVVIMVNHAQQV